MSWVVGIILLLIVLHIAIAAGFAVHVLLRRRDPMSMLSWLLAILLLPFVGSAAYYLLSENQIRRRAYGMRGDVSLHHNLKECAENEETPHEAAPKRFHTVEQVGASILQIAATGHNVLSVSNSPPKTYDAWEEAIRNAQHHVHMEYYIWSDNDEGCRFRDLVVEKAREGVECRVLMDAIGSAPSKEFLQSFREAGVEVSLFLPVLNLSKVFPNLRNHRKILVIDGSTAFVGSQNIGADPEGILFEMPDDFFETHMRVQGPAVLFLQQVFVNDWKFSTGNDLCDDVYFPVPEAADGAIVQIIPTGPDSSPVLLERMLHEALTAAESSIRIATPYFVPSPEMRMALSMAAMRGVKVSVVLPKATDKPMVLWASRSFYEELMADGVDIYEFQKGMLHSKLVVVDEEWALIGSANMDMRSFRVNFEVSAACYDKATADKLAGIVDTFSRDAAKQSLEAVRNRSRRQHLIEGAARLLSPQL